MSESTPAPAHGGVLSAEYLAEMRDLASLPAEGPPEIAISGRSNVGKSTLLNRLAGRHALARTSKTPGRTRGLIFYDLALRAAADQPSALRFVDLPGYGYAQVGRKERRGWGPLVEGYVQRRSTLCLVLVLVDARRGPEDEEHELCEWLGSLSVPRQVIITKTDKLPVAERGLLRDRMRQRWGAGAPPMLAVSGQTGDGLDKLWRLMLHAAVPAPDVAIDRPA